MSTKKQLAEELDDAASTPPSSPEREVPEADEDENIAEMLAKEIGIGAEEAEMLLENDKAGRSFDQLTTAEQEQLYNALSKADRGGARQQPTTRRRNRAMEQSDSRPHRARSELSDGGRCEQCMQLMHTAVHAVEQLVGR